MPEGFEKCREKGGRIRTVSGPHKLFGLKKGQYMHVCFLDNKMYRGEIKTKKEK
jgi:hypothetical protein